MSVLKTSLILSLIDNVSGRARGINAAINGVRASQNAMLGMAGRIIAFGGAYLGVTQGLQNTAGAAMEFESAFADVRKVVDASEQQFDYLRRTILQMSTELPLAANDIAALFAAAGESGVATADLKDFAEMAARVGIAFDMTAGEAGDSLAKLKTQLGLTVGETGDLADAINHLSNNMASKAKDVTEFMLRVGALAEMGGFTAEQVAGIGSAMIAAGAQSETAGTAMQNVVKALTRGKFAKKEQRDAAKALGLDLPTIAKQMQKDAPGTLKKVLGAIAKAPKSQHIALLSQFFGDEAKAFAPLIGNIGLLDQALGSVSDKTKYAGSAFREYVARANTTANVLQLLRNKFAEVGVAIGDEMLPSIKEAALGVGDILDTLGERATIFDQMSVAMKGFLQGFGVDGGVRETINDLGDLLFGEANGSAAADKLGRIFAKFKDWGASVRELSSAISNNPLAKFFADLAPYGFQLMLWSTGILMLAGTIRKLAAALMFLSGASAILSALKAVGTIAAIAGGGTPGPGGPPRGAPSGPGGAVPPKGGGGISNALKSLGAAAVALGVVSTLGGRGEVRRLTAEEQRRMFVKRDDHPSPIVPTIPGLSAFTALDSANRARAAGFGGSTENLPGKTADDVIRIDASSIAAMTKPSGVQSVLVTNPQPPVINQSNVFNITTSDPQAAANSAADQMGAKVKSAVESGWLDSQ
jgi:TP901 family phage tail tape measure protein